MWSRGCGRERQARRQQERSGAESSGLAGNRARFASARTTLHSSPGDGDVKVQSALPVTTHLRRLLHGRSSCLLHKQEGGSKAGSRITMPRNRRGRAALSVLTIERLL